MRAGTYYQASKSLDRSIGIDDQFALAHARLADTYNEIDNTEKAREELLHALSLVPDRTVLVKTDLIYLDAVGATIRRDLDAAIEHYRELVNQTPDIDKANAYVDLGRSFLIGDKEIDAECAHNAGLRAIRVRTGFDKMTDGSCADWVADDLSAAAEIILKAANE